MIVLDVGDHPVDPYVLYSVLHSLCFLFWTLLVSHVVPSSLSSSPLPMTGGKLVIPLVTVHSHTHKQYIFDHLYLARYPSLLEIMTYHFHNLKEILILESRRLSKHLFIYDFF